MTVGLEDEESDEDEVNSDNEISRDVLYCQSVISLTICAKSIQL